MSLAMPSILEKIVAEKQQEVAQRSRKMPIELLENLIIEQNNVPRGFYNAMLKQREQGLPAVIAEIKKASPSKGIIRDEFDPLDIALDYEKHGATCLSVLTDEAFFQGSDSFLDIAREATKLPVLRKDFIIDEYQVFEARMIGADCVLLIAACLTHDQMYQLTRLAYDLGMDVLVEVHDLDDLDKTAGLPVRMIGINNRNLHTFEVDLSVSFDLSLMIPSEVLVITESGISTPEEVRLLMSAGISGFLVGESLMRSDSPGEKLQELFGNALPAVTPQ